MTRLYNRTSERELRRTLRRNMPKVEVMLWAKIRSRQLAGCKFRRQYSVGPFVVDFYAPETKLAIELDGESHSKSTAREYDRERQQYIEQFGIQFLRFTNREIEHNLGKVLVLIARKVEELRKVKMSFEKVNKGDEE